MNVFLYTVGTGTKGDYSNVSEGILAAIRYNGNGEHILLPSNSSESTAVATIVSEGAVEENLSIAKLKYVALSDHDSVLNCRKEIRDIIVKIKREQPDSEIVVNPTSGTKQMTIAAFMAAIDEEIPNIQFITGKRKDGVVISGKEKIREVSGRDILAEYSMRNAILLIESGAYNGAIEILKPYQNIYGEISCLAKMLGAWDCFDYIAALQKASAMSGVFWGECRKRLERLRSSKHLSYEQLADMFNFTRRRLDQKKPEEALAVLYRAVELLCKLQLCEYYDLEQEDALEGLISHPELKIDSSLKDKLRNIQKNSGLLMLGLQDAVKILMSGNNRVAEVIFSKIIWNTLRKRNHTRYGHGREYVENNEVEALYWNLLNLCNEIPDFKGNMEKLAFPDFSELLKKSSI